MKPPIAATGVPLVRGHTPDAPFAIRRDGVVTLGGFLADVEAVAASLPPRRHVVNLCADRYHFTVGFAAALCRGQASLLPPMRTPDFLARLAAEYPDTYCLIDADPAAGDADRAAGEGDRAAREPEHVKGPFDVVPIALSAPARGAAGPLPAFAPERVAAISFTSGSTGAPTPHVKRWGALARGALAEAAVLGLDRLAGAALIGTVPAQHMYGFESTVLLALHGGCVLSAERPFYPLDVRAALERAAAPRVLVTTPVHLRALSSDAVALPPLALVVSATAPLPLELAQAVESRYGAPVHEIYGFTEAGMVAARRTLDGAPWTPLPGVHLRRDSEHWWAEGGHVPVPVRFADRIEVAADGRFVLQGRHSDVVNIAGKRASLASLDHHLQSVPGVLDGAYFMPAAGGPATRLAAFVVAPALDARDVLAALRVRVDSAFLPRPLHFVAALPRNATGKLTLDALQGLERECAMRR